jgi:streptogramin lyase
MAALAAMAFACAQSAGAQTPPQSCKYATRVAHGQDVAIVRASDGSLWYASQSANRIVRVGPQRRGNPFRAGRWIHQGPLTEGLRPL